MKFVVTRKYEVDVTNVDGLTDFLRDNKLPVGLSGQLLDTCTRYLDEGEKGPLFLQQQTLRLDWNQKPPEYEWVVEGDLESHPKPIYGPVEWAAKEIEYDID